MSKAGTLLSKENKPTILPAQILSGFTWTELINAVTFQDETLFSDMSYISEFENWHLLDEQARAMAVSLYKAAQILSQTVVASIRFLHSSSFIQQPQEDLWVEMPPRSVRDVVMNVQRMGRGKPSNFFDELSEE